MQEYSNCSQIISSNRGPGVSQRFGFLGFDGGELKSVVDQYLWLPTETGAYGLVEDGHAVLCHILTRCLTQGQPPTLEKGQDR